MARTAEAAALTERHRRAQLQVRARAIQDFMLLWPLWNGDERSFASLVAATLPLVRAHHTVSASLAAAYVEQFRRADRVAGTAAVRTAPLIVDEQVVSSLYVTGKVMTGKAVLAGQSPRAAMQTALVRTSGAVSRHILAGGRDTVILSAAEDKLATGWARVTGGNPCAFCAMLASRGPVYREDTADFQAHDHCSCSAEPSYEGSDWPGRAREFQRLWREHAKGPNPLQSFRRAFEHA